MNIEKTKEKYKKLIKEALEELKDKDKRYKQIPNILTTSRLLAPFVIIPSAITGNVVLTGALAATFALSDMVDGYVARKYHLQSELGASLDAITDKVFAGTLLIASSIMNPYLLINLALELGIAGINIKEELKDNKAKSNVVGKLKTWFVFILSGLGIVSKGLNIDELLKVLAGVTGILQVATIATYIDQYKNEEKDKLKQEEKNNIPVKIDEEVSSDNEKEKTKIISSTKENDKKDISEQIRELKEMREFLTTPSQEEKLDKSKIFEKK